MGGKEEIRFELKITYSNTMMNCWLSQKLKLLENCELNHLLIILMVWNKKTCHGLSTWNSILGINSHPVLE